MNVEAARLCAREQQTTAEWIASHQQPSGEILWSLDGKSDPWDHVHAAMALTVQQQYERAQAAFRYLARIQEPNGAFAAERVGGFVTRGSYETNHAAYLATGLWHYYCATEDVALLAELWPNVERAIDWVVSLQLPSGAIAWAEKKGKIWHAPLITGSSSIHGSLVCAQLIAARLGHDQPAWRSAWRKLARVLRHDMQVFYDTDLPEQPGRYSMDWYYPVLAGAVRGAAGRERLLDAELTAAFIEEGVGCRCVRDAPWYTIAETCELVLALDALGQRERAKRMFGWTRAQRTDNGAYWTGATHPEKVIFPEGEQTTWTAAAVIIAQDTLFESSRTSSFFRDLDGRALELAGTRERVSRSALTVPDSAAE
jgi:GH15 family glucan-1,4-alpha-glucosidase